MLAADVHEGGRELGRNSRLERVHQLPVDGGAAATGNESGRRPALSADQADSSSEA